MTKDLVTHIGITNWHNDNKRFGIKDNDRLRHIYCIGKSGTGKTTLLKNMAISDIERGLGAGILDPHGDLTEELLARIPAGRMDDVIYFNSADTAFPVAFNPLKGIHPSHHHLVASGLVSAFKKLWYESWGPRMEYILRFSLLTLLEYRKGTLLDIQPLLTDKAFRDQVLTKCINPALISFWRNEFEKYPAYLRAEAIAPILNKVGLFQTMPLRNIVGQSTRSFSMQDVLDQGKILIVNLSKGQIGEDAAALLGSMIVTQIQMAALYRSRYPEDRRRLFYLYVDECHSFITLSFADMLSEARKYGLGLFLTHQYIDQLPENIKNAVIGNVGTLISFRVGAADAEFLEKEFEPLLEAQDLITLPRYSMYLKLMIDGTTSLPFSADTLPPKVAKISDAKEVIALSRKYYGKPRAEVEEEISARYRQANNEQASLFKP